MICRWEQHDSPGEDTSDVLIRFLRMDATERLTLRQATPRRCRDEAPCVVGMPNIEGFFNIWRGIRICPIQAGAGPHYPVDEWKVARCCSLALRDKLLGDGRRARPAPRIVAGDRQSEVLLEPVDRLRLGVGIGHTPGQERVEGDCAVTVVVADEVRFDLRLTQRGDEWF